VLVFLGEVPSKSEADRLVKQKAVEVNERLLSDIGADVDLCHPATYVVRIGKKKFFRFVVS